MKPTEKEWQHKLTKKTVFDGETSAYCLQRLLCKYYVNSQCNWTWAFELRSAKGVEKWDKTIVGLLHFSDAWARVIHKDLQKLFYRLGVGGDLFNMIMDHFNEIFTSILLIGKGSTSSCKRTNVSFGPCRETSTPTTWYGRFQKRQRMSMDCLNRIYVQERKISEH